MTYQNNYSANLWQKFYKKLENPQKISPNCVDGRGWETKDSLPGLAPQALGGSLHFAVLYCLYHEQPLTVENIAGVFKTLKEKGFSLGLHIDDHNKDNPEKSGCGFADNLPKILKNTFALAEQISQKLNNPSLLSKLKISTTALDNELGKLLEAVQNLPIEKIPSGNQLIQKLQDKNPQITVYELKGEHEEKVALVNFKPKTTFDTRQAAQKGHQAFNLDLAYVPEGAKALGIPKEFTKVASLALYLATERTLRAGKDPLPLIVI